MYFKHWYSCLFVIKSVNKHQRDRIRIPFTYVAHLEDQVLVLLFLAKMKLLSTILIAFGAAIHGSWGLRFTMDCCGTSGHTGAVETADGGSGTKEVVLVTDAASEEEDTINPAPEEKEGEPESKEEETEGSKASDAEGTEETPKTPAEKTPAGDEGEGAKPSEGAAASGDE
ncbi:unnamed protein product, partial [Amoebophrya sp. A25]|eukprot:GSA25T00012643001.1